MPAPDLPSPNRQPFPGAQAWRAAVDEPPAPASGASEAYVGFLAAAAAAEEARADAFVGRSDQILSGSSTLVGLLLALTGLAVNLDAVVVPLLATLLVAGAALALLGAAGCAVRLNHPKQVWALDPDRLRADLWARWDDPRDRPLEKVAATHLAEIAAMRDLGQWRSQWVSVAVWCQATGTALLVLAAGVVVLAGRG